MIEIVESGPALSDGEIAAFEAGARIRIPPQLRAFLLKTNGGRPRVFTRSDLGHKTDVAQFFQLFRRSRDDRMADMSGRISRDLLWFAHDSGGGVFGIAHTGPAFGKIFWCDLPHTDTERPAASECILVAATLNAFLEGLREDPIIL